MKKISVGVLGATGMVGQKFVELLSSHPWFEIKALAASDKNVGKSYGETVNWLMRQPLSPKMGNMKVHPCVPILPCQLVFSGLPSNVAKEIEESFAFAGYKIVSNSSSHRMDSVVPLLIPEVNSAHLELLKYQKYGQGGIVTNPNCSVIGLTMALKPLLDRWGLQDVNVVTLQALSGAGYPGISSVDILDNVIPYISGEEDKMETEPLKILGHYENTKILPYPMKLSAQCIRVSVADGHLACVSVKLKKKAKKAEIIEAWNSFLEIPQNFNLPTSPSRPIVYLEDERHPQPKLHRYLENGMAVSVGRLRECPILDWKFIILSHNTIRGAAGCALLNAELMMKLGYLGKGH